MKRIILLTIIFILLSVLQVYSQQVKHRFLAAGSGSKNVVIVNSNGSVEWEYPVGGECNDVSMLSDSTVLFSHRSGAKLVNLAKEVLWEYKGEKGTEVQSASPLSNGNFLLIQNGHPAKLMEINKKGKIKREFVIPTKTKKVHGQFRNVRKTKKGTYLVGYIKESKVCEFSKRGKLLRTIDIKGNGFASIRLPNGNTLIACGDGHHLIEVDQQDKVVWEVTQNEIPGHPLRYVAGVQRLPNGNTIICNWGGHGHRETQAQVFEITRNKKVVWQVNDWKQFRMLSSIQVLDKEITGRMEKAELLR